MRKAPHKWKMAGQRSECSAGPRAASQPCGRGQRGSAPGSQLPSPTQTIRWGPKASGSVLELKTLGSRAVCSEFLRFIVHSWLGNSGDKGHLSLGYEDPPR